MMKKLLGIVCMMPLIAVFGVAMYEDVHSVLKEILEALFAIGVVASFLIGIYLVIRE